MIIIFFLLVVKESPVYLQLDLSQSSHATNYRLFFTFSAEIFQKQLVHLN